MTEIYPAEDIYYLTSAFNPLSYIPLTQYSPVAKSHLQYIEYKKKWFFNEVPLWGWCWFNQNTLEQQLKAVEHELSQIHIGYKKFTYIQDYIRFLEKKRDFIKEDMLFEDIQGLKLR